MKISRKLGGRSCCASIDCVVRTRSQSLTIPQLLVLRRVDCRRELRTSSGEATVVLVWCRDPCILLATTLPSIPDSHCCQRRRYKCATVKSSLHRITVQYVCLVVWPLCVPAKITGIPTNRMLPWRAREYFTHSQNSQKCLT